MSGEVRTCPGQDAQESVVHGWHGTTVQGATKLACRAVVIHLRACRRQERADRAEGVPRSMQPAWDQLAPCAN